MDKCIYKGVDIFNPIAGKMKYFVDAFTNVYGEKYRSVIEKRLKSAEYYFLGGKFSNIILKFKQLEQEEIKKIEEQQGITPSLIKLKKKNIHDRYNLIINIFENTQKQMDIVTYKYADISNNILINHFNNIRKKNKLDELPKLEAQKYISTLYDLLYNGKISLTQKSALLSDNRKKEYTKLFNVLGFYEKDFNSFMKNKKLLNKVFDNYVILQINKSNEFRNEELDKINFCVADLKYHLKNLNIYKDSKGYENLATKYIQNKTNNSAFVINCLTNDAQFKTLCFCKNALELTLEDLTHEMGHIIDAFVVESNQDGYYYKSGFELHYQGFTYRGYENSIVPEFGEKNYRQAELFNEIINDYITKKVARELQKTNKTFTFGEKQKNAKVKYEYGFEVFDEFIERYQDKLIELKMKVDKNESAYEYFGKENLEKLFIIAKEYIDNRTELNPLIYRNDKNTIEYLEKYKNETKAKIEAIMKKIEKHISKNQSKKNSNEFLNSKNNEPLDNNSNKSNFKNKFKKFMNNFKEKNFSNEKDL